MYLLAFCGDIQNPLLYSLDDKKWYYPNGKLYTTFKMNDSVPVPGRDYHVANRPSDPYTIVSLNENANSVVVSHSGKVELWFLDKFVPGKEYQTDFFLLCPIPDHIDQSTLIFKDQMILPYGLSLPEAPFIQHV